MKFRIDKIIAYLALTLLGLGLALCVAQAQFINSYLGNYGSGGAPSASSLTSGHLYNGTKDMWVYLPPGYADNADNYPLAIFYGGDGTRGTDPTLFFTEANCIKYINDGDEPPGIIICAPQIPSGDYAIAAQFTDVMTYMTTNYRVNTNRVYATGLSRGGFMTRLLMVNAATTSVAAYLQFAGTTSSITWADLTNRGVWLHHGTTDGTVTNSLFTAMSNANVSTLDMNISALATNYFGVGHTSTVWGTNGYNRRDRTDATGTALYDWVKWVKKFSLDQTERATLHVDYAESENTIEDYRLALIQVNALSAGADKTALLARLSTLKSSLDNGGKRYIIDHGTSTQTTSGNVNNMTAHTSTSSISSLIDDTGGSSSIGFTMVAQFASSAREANLTSDCVRGQYFGLDRQTYRDGMTINTAITNGSCKFTGLNNAKQYDIRFYVARSSSTLTNDSELSITVGGSTKTQYCNLNTTRYIDFTNISPTSGEITIAADVTLGNDNAFIVAMELYLHP